MNEAMLISSVDTIKSQTSALQMDFLEFISFTDFQCESSENNKCHKKIFWDFKEN